MCGGSLWGWRTVNSGRRSRGAGASAAAFAPGPLGPAIPPPQRARASSRCSAPRRSASAGEGGAEALYRKRSVHRRLQATYLVRCDAQAIEERARAIAVEQSVEMPLTAIADDFVRSQIVGRVEGISERQDRLFEIRISLAAETVGRDPGQLLNMLFGNTSLHEDVELADVALPTDLMEDLGGPRHGLHELRRRVGASARALTSSPLKPQGLPPAGLARLAADFAQAGIDYIKDDHGLADQVYSPFARPLESVMAALPTVQQRTRRAARCVPSLSADLDTTRSHIAAPNEPTAA